MNTPETSPRSPTASTLADLAALLGQASVATKPADVSPTQLDTIERETQRIQASVVASFDVFEQAQSAPPPEQPPPAPAQADQVLADALALGRRLGLQLDAQRVREIGATAAALEAIERHDAAAKLGSPGETLTDGERVEAMHRERVIAAVDDDDARRDRAWADACTCRRCQGQVDPAFAAELGKRLARDAAQRRPRPRPLRRARRLARQLAAAIASLDWAGVVLVLALVAPLMVFAELRGAAELALLVIKSVTVLATVVGACVSIGIALACLPEPKRLPGEPKRGGK